MVNWRQTEGKARHPDYLAVGRQCPGQEAISANRIN
jgi:hypothetical protein